MAQDARLIRTRPRGTITFAVRIFGTAANILILLSSKFAFGFRFSQFN